MNATTQQSPLAQERGAALTPEMFTPLAYWASGFEYAFGYQMQLFWDFWGFTHGER